MWQVWPGAPEPLGATFDGDGVNFAVLADVASRVELCLFDAAGHQTAVDLPERTDGIFHGYLPGIGPGQRYGFRVHGPYDPGRGHRCNPAKLLLDPYAKAVDGDYDPTGPVYGYAGGDPYGPVPDLTDSAQYVPKSVVVGALDGPDPAANRPGTPLADTVIAELHVRGFTRHHPDVPVHLRGTYAGLAHPACVDYLTALGVTAVELLPVAHFLDEPDLRARGLVNYWGYNPIAFFAPHARYAATWGGQVGEFRAMTHALHEAGLEVIVDVVFNHTAEGNEHGPTLCLRGLDNRAYYRLPRSSQAGYSNYTGTGNSLDTRYPAGLRLVLDALRYWVTVLGVDGFRFDLAPVLARSPRRFEPNAAFLQAAFADPVLRQVKLIAEPWDASDGYALGRFPRGWAEWNDKFRDGVRRFWLTGCELRELGFRLSGSSDVFGGKAPDSSVNYVTCHDGSPLRDLVSYVDKHNEANGYGNSDGMNGEVRVNLGVEGDDEDLLPVRRSLARAMLATLLLTPGVPMLLAGDERWRTQRGNNNAFCQDNEVSWVDWAVDPGGLPELVRRLLALRRRMPSVRAHRFYTGQPVDPDAAVPDLAWFRPDGRQMAPADWSSQSRTLGAYFDGRGRRLGPRGERLSGDSWLLLLHAGDEPCWFTLPGRPYAGKYHVELDTNTPTGEPIGADPVPAGTTYVIPPRSVAALRAG